jgi:hypothetical protein
MFVAVGGGGWLVVIGRGDVISVGEELGARTVTVTGSGFVMTTEQSLTKFTTVTT